MFIDNRAYPGGPNAWFFAFYSAGTNTAGNSSYVVANALADGVLVRTTDNLSRSYSKSSNSSGAPIRFGTAFGSYSFRSSFISQAQVSYNSDGDPAVPILT